MICDDIGSAVCIIEPACQPVKLGHVTGVQVARSQGERRLPEIGDGDRAACHRRGLGRGAGPRGRTGPLLEDPGILGFRRHLDGPAALHGIDLGRRCRTPLGRGLGGQDLRLQAAGNRSPGDLLDVGPVGLIRCHHGVAAGVVGTLGDRDLVRVGGWADRAGVQEPGRRVIAVGMDTAAGLGQKNDRVLPALHEHGDVVGRFFRAKGGDPFGGCRIGQIEDLDDA